VAPETWPAKINPMREKPAAHLNCLITKEPAIITGRNRAGSMPQPEPILPYFLRKISSPAWHWENPWQLPPTLRAGQFGAGFSPG
jgi:hypothetical protein